MNRIGLFRGKRFDNGEWIYGFLVVDPNGKNRIFYQPFAGATHNTWYYVIPETVGQFTRLTTKNGTCIFEGDLLKVPANDYIREGTHRVFYYHDSFVTSSTIFSHEETAAKNSLTWIIERGAEVIGNIHGKEVANG